MNICFLFKLIICIFFIRLEKNIFFWKIWFKINKIINEYVGDMDVVKYILVKYIWVKNIF